MMPKENVQDNFDGSFKEQLSMMSKEGLFRIMRDCADFTEDEVIETVVALGAKFADEGLTRKDKLILTPLGYSTDEKQYGLGIDMLQEFVPREECEKYMVAIYKLAGKKEGQIKSMARMKAAVYMMRTRPEADLQEVVAELSDRHASFVELMTVMRDRSMISEPVVPKNDSQDIPS